MQKQNMVKHQKGVGNTSCERKDNGKKLKSLTKTRHDALSAEQPVQYFHGCPKILGKRAFYSFFAISQSK